MCVITVIAMLIFLSAFLDKTKGLAAAVLNTLPALWMCYKAFFSFLFFLASLSLK